mgnify:CR=1 FL=1
MAGYTNFFDGPFFDGPFFDAQTLNIGGGGSHPSQGYGGHEVRKRTREEVRLERERLGIIPKRVERIIEEVAKRQAEKLELDRQKQFEELSRELKLKNIEWEGRFLEALNKSRERLIDLEIASRIKVKLRDEQDIISLLTLAAALA